MPKFKHLFLAILLGSFVSSNNIGYSMENLENNPVDNYNIWSLQSNMNKLVRKTNKLVCKNDSYYNQVFLDLKNNIKEFNDAINQQNLSKIQQNVSNIKGELSILKQPNFSNIENNKVYLRYIELLINRICNIYFREKMSLDQDQIFISYAGSKISTTSQFNNELTDINSLANTLFYNRTISSNIIRRFEYDFKFLMKHITEMNTAYRFDEMVKYAFSTIKSLLQINEINSQVEIKTLIETIRQKLIEICVYYINTNIFKYNINITDLF